MLDMFQAKNGMNECGVHGNRGSLGPPPAFGVAPGNEHVTADSAVSICRWHLPKMG